MHELSLMADLMKKVESIAAEQKAASVLEVKVKLGALAHISPGHFRDHFSHAARGTVAQGARLFVELSEDAGDPFAQEIVLESVTIEGA